MTLDRFLCHAVNASHWSYPSGHPILRPRSEAGIVSTIGESWRRWNRLQTKVGHANGNSARPSRRKCFELHTANQSQIAVQALEQIGQLYEIERQAQHMPTEERLRMRQQQSRSRG